MKNGVEVTYQKDESSPLVGPVLTILLPMLFVIVMFYLFIASAAGWRWQGDELRQEPSAPAQ